MKLSDTSIDVAKREAGDWVRDIPDMPGLGLKTRGIGNKDWRKRRDKLIAAVPRNRRIDGLGADDVDRINAVLLRDCALLDWEGLEDDAGNPLPFSKEQAGEYLNNPELERFRDACMWAATVVAERQATETEADVKN